LCKKPRYLIEWWFSISIDYIILKIVFLYTTIFFEVIKCAKF